MLEIIDQDWIHFVTLVALAAVIAGFLAGLFGIGGGIVMVPVFSEVYIRGGTDPNLAQFMAVGTSLAIIIPTSLRSMQAHLKMGNVEHEVLRAYFWFIPTGALLAISFANTSLAKDTQVLRLVFGLTACLISIYMLMRPKEHRLHRASLQAPFMQVWAISVGFLSLLMGIGGGLMNNLFMVIQGIPVKRAIGTSSAVGALISVPGALGFIWIGWGDEGLPPFSWGYVNWLTFVLAIPITILMAPIGAQVTQHLSNRLTSRLFGLFLFALGVRMLWTLWAAGS